MLDQGRHPDRWQLLYPLVTCHLSLHAISLLNDDDPSTSGVRAVNFHSRASR